MWFIKFLHLLAFFTIQIDYRIQLLSLLPPPSRLFPFVGQQYGYPSYSHRHSLLNLLVISSLVKNGLQNWKAFPNCIYATSFLLVLVKSSSSSQSNQSEILLKIINLRSIMIWWYVHQIRIITIMIDIILFLYSYRKRWRWSWVD